MVATSILIGAMIAATATSTAIAVTGQVKAGRAAKRVGESQGQLDEYNAGVADLEAKDALRRGGEEEARFASSVAGVVGTQRAGFAGQNVDVATGSAADVQADATRLGQLDITQIRRNAQREAWGHSVEAENYRRGAVIARQGGQAQLTASKYAAAGTLLGGASSLLLARYGWGNSSSTPNFNNLPPAYLRGV
jgi:hypothetical protein